MPTETNLTIDFSAPELLEFARSAELTLVDPTFASRRKFLIDQGYQETSEVRKGPDFNPADEVRPDPSNGKTGFWGVMQAEIRTYDLVENSTGAIQSQVETQAIHSQPILISIWHKLFVSDTVSNDEKTKIISAFKSYEDSPGTNPDDFATSNDITAGSYEAIAYFQIEKSGLPTIDDGQDREIKIYYQRDESHRLRLRSNRFEEIRERDDGSIEVDDPEDEGNILEELAKIVENSPAMECVGIEYKQERIATLIQYPEFKIRWRRISFKVGCVRISMKVPQLMYRNNKRVLYAGLAHEVNLDQIIVAVLKHCLLKSALAASIAGLATANVGVAGAAFKALFAECINTQFGQYLKVFASRASAAERARWLASGIIIKPVVNSKLRLGPCFVEPT